MVPRELIALATLTLALSVATSAVTGAAVAAAASIDFDLTPGGADYEILPDADDKTSTADNDDVADFPENSQSSSSSSTHRRGGSNSAGHHHHHHHHHNSANNNNNSNNGSGSGGSKHEREVRCYCNQPHCVSQGYMCRGRGCFTDLPTLSYATAKAIAKGDAPSFRPEHASYSGCLERSFTERSCPQGKLCCEQDLCNHIDSPAMRQRLNKTLQVLLGEQRAFIGLVHVPGEKDEQVPSSVSGGSDGWFRLATITVPILGFFVLIALASMAIRLLQPLPSQGDKLNGLRMPENAPPLLGPPKLPLV